MVWLSNFLSELKVDYGRPVMHVDNRSAIRMIRNNEMQRRTKHIDIKFHYVRSQYMLKKFKLESVDTEVQLADYLTKPLPGPRLKTLMQLSSVIPKLS